MTPKCNTNVLHKEKQLGRVARRVTSMRLDPELWAEFKADVRRKHLTTCQVTEALMSAFVYSGAYVPGLGGSLKLNLTINRGMERASKQPRQPTEKATINHYVATKGWFFDDTLEPGLMIIEQPKCAGLEEKGFTWNREHRYYVKKNPKSMLKRSGTALEWEL